MATIYYEILSGQPPFTAELRDNDPPYSTIDIMSDLGIGVYYFTNVPDGNYIVIITDNLECIDYFIANVNCVTTTTTIICDVYAEIEEDTPTTSTTTSTSTSTTTSTSSTTTTTTTIPPTTTTTTTSP